MLGNHCWFEKRSEGNFLRFLLTNGDEVKKLIFMLGLNKS